MSPAPAARAFEVRHLQLARAAFAAIAAAMITFSPDHSAQVGLSAFSGFAIATGLVHLLAAWLVYPPGARWPSVLLGITAAAAGMVGGLVALRSTALLFALVITWAALSGIIETIAGARALRATSRGDASTGSLAQRSEARDAVAVGILSFVLALALALVPSGYALQYSIEEAGRSFTLTQATIGVGIVGGYAAIAAVYLAIAGLSPKRQSAADRIGAGDGRGTA